MKTVKIWAASSGGRSTTVTGEWSTFGELKTAVNNYLSREGLAQIDFSKNTAFVKSDNPDLNKMTYEADSTVISNAETKIFLTPKVKAEAGNCSNPNFAAVVGNINNSDDAEAIIQALIEKFNSTQSGCDCDDQKEDFQDAIDALDDVIENAENISINYLKGCLKDISAGFKEVLENLSSVEDREYRDFINSLK